MDIEGSMFFLNIMVLVFMFHSLACFFMLFEDSSMRIRYTAFMAIE